MADKSQLHLIVFCLMATAHLFTTGSRLIIIGDQEYVVVLPSTPSIFL